MKIFISKYIKKSSLCLTMALPLTCGMMTSCSDEHMAEINTDTSKSEKIDPNSLLTTSLLQTYGDFSLMDTYRSYVTGFTQHFAGGWNVTNYAGSVHAYDQQSNLIWDRFYTVAIKHLVDGIRNSEDQPALNAMLRIHRVYIMSVLTDIYGNIPYFEAGLGYYEGISNPKYDNQQDIYADFFKELTECVKQLDENSAHVTGDVTSLNGNVSKWQKYANSLRMRFAMRISDADPTKAKTEFEAAMNDSHGYIADATDNAYVIYTNSPFTLYPGAKKFDFRVNALGEMLYGQDSESPTFVCSTLFNQMKNTNDPRLYRICRHYMNRGRSEISPDKETNRDYTDELLAYMVAHGQEDHPCNPGQAWYNGEWLSAPDPSEMPSLAKLIEQEPNGGYLDGNYPVRMMRPFLSVDFEMPDCPGVLITSAEVHLLMAEAKTKGWAVSQDAEALYEQGVKESMQIINDYYLKDNKITEQEMNNFIAANKLGDNPKKTINTQAWILHMMNPAEAWANLRRSDYPVLMDRSKLDKYDGFTYDDENLTTPTRLKYPQFEAQYNNEKYKEALQVMGGTDDWHQHVWWDKNDINVK